MAAIALSDGTADVGSDMELRQLRIFIAIARTGNLTRAARNLASSQPAVSAQLKALEEELGVVLFARTARGMELTEAGALLRAKAEEVQARAADLLAVAGRLSGKVTGTARIGLNTEAGVLRVAELVEAIATRAPQLGLELVQGTSAGVVRDVASGRLSAGFVFGPHGHAGLEALTLARIALVIAAPAAWAARLAGAPDQVRAGPWVWPPRDCPYHDAAIALVRGEGADGPGGVAADDEATLLRLVAAGVGLALVPAPLAEEAAAGGQVAVLRSTGTEVALSFVWRAGEWRGGECPRTGSRPAPCRRPAPGTRGRTWRLRPLRAGRAPGRDGSGSASRARPSSCRARLSAGPRSPSATSRRPPSSAPAAPLPQAGVERRHEPVEVLRRDLREDRSDLLEPEEVGESLRPLPLRGVRDGVLSVPAFPVDRGAERARKEPAQMVHGLGREPLLLLGVQTACTLPETDSGGMREHRDLGPREGLGSHDEFIDSLHERLDGSVRVVAGDVVMELLPEPLDDVRLRRVGRQEVEHDAAAELGQVAQRPLRFVDDEVVEDEVDAPGAPVGAPKRIDQREEELRILPLGGDVDDLAVAQLVTLADATVLQIKDALARTFPGTSNG